MAGQFEDSDTDEDLFASPSAKATSKAASKSAASRKDAQPERPKTPKTPTPQQTGGSSSYEASTTAEAREATLQRELQGVRQINELIEGVISTLDRAKGNMGTVSRTVNTASTLLNTWTRILSQTEHNQRLLLNPTWKGATADLVELENEAAQKQAAAERRAAEEERRQAEAARRREEEQRQREAGASGRGTTTRGRTTRGRTVTRGAATRGSSRGTTYGVGGRVQQSGSSAIPGARPTSGLGRGLGSTRGRARGTRGT